MQAIAVDREPALNEEVVDWTQRKHLQVQKMEATIEQDLSKAMAGIRQQFRQQFDEATPSSLAEPAELEPDTALAEAQFHATRRDGDDYGLNSRSEATKQDEEDSCANHKSEATVAAREEVLGGLARLRRDLEMERARQSSSSTSSRAPPVVAGVVERECQQLQ